MTLPYVYSPRFDIAKSLPHLQRTILERVQAGYVNYAGYNGIEITATLRDVSEAIESAYILTPKADLPKVTDAVDGSFSIEEFGALYPHGSRTPENARKRAAAWLSVAAHLEREEKAKAAEEAKAKVVAEAAAACAKQARLNDISHLHFGKDYNDLGPNKASAVTEIHRLETQLNAKDEA